MFDEKYKRACDAVKLTDTEKDEILHNVKAKKTKRDWWIAPVAVAACLCLVAVGVLAILPNKYKASNNGKKTAANPAENAQSYKDVYDVISKLRADRTADGLLYETNGLVKSATNISEVDTVPTQASSDDYSKTNVQIEGVDESDIVKTDGKYIYVLSFDTAKGVRIFKADGKDTVCVGKVNYAKDQNTNTKFASEENSIFYIANGMYLADDTLIVIAWKGKYPQTRYMCCDWYFPSTRDGETHIFCYDIQNPESPKLISEIEQDGYYIESRLTGGVLYTVTTYGVGIWDDMNFEDTDKYIPKYKDSKSEELVKAEDITLLGNAESAHYCFATAVDIKKTDEVKSSIAILGQVNGLFASHSNILLYNTYYDYEEHRAVEDGKGGITYVSESDDVETYAWKDIYKTDIFLVKMNDGKLGFEKSRTLDGWIDDQFSIDEYKDNLRILLNVSNTETLLTKHYDDEGNYDGQVFEAGRPIVENRYNTLLILDMNLETVGQISDIAKGEMVKSARYMGDVGYFVTFRNTDPLFSVDLKDPKNPKIIGSLKIPGFSEYLQSYGEGLLFGLGFDADTEEGSVTGVKMSMFDVSDPADVKEIAKKVYKDKWSSSVYNHKAILANPDKNLIGFSWGDSYVVFSYENGEFVQKADIQTSGGWSYDLRGLYIGNYFYIADMQNNTVTVLDLTTFECVATAE